MNHDVSVAAAAAAAAAAVMNSRQQGQNTYKDGDLPVISKLSLDNNGVGAPAGVGEGVDAGGGGGEGHIRKICVAEKPSLNILNQAINVTQLDANQTSFDPTQVLPFQAATAVTSSVDLQQTQQLQQPMISSYLMQPSHSHSSNNTPSVASSQPTVLLMPNQMPPQIPPQSAAVSLVQQPVQQQLSAQPSADTVFQHTSAQLEQTSAAAEVKASVGTVGAAKTGISTQVQKKQQQQQQAAPQQQTQQPVYQEKQDYHYSDRKSLVNGRVPATRRDGRKLFVGGLPNEVTDRTFLHFFQQYGEVIDSVVLLDRRTKRSRGFGFVTFADPNVAASLLTTIPGRTGMVNIMGKNCEVKASEPKTTEAVQYAHSNVNNSHGWNQMNQMPQRMVLGVGGTLIHPLQANQTMSVPPNVNYGVSGGGEGGGSGMPVYSHSTITRTTAGPIISADGVPHEGAANVYIQNNFYYPGTELQPPPHALPTTEVSQRQKTEMSRDGAGVDPTTVATVPQYDTSYSSSALQTSFPGTNGIELGLPKEHQQINALSHLHKMG